MYQDREDDSNYSIWFRLLWMALFYLVLFIAIELITLASCIAQTVLVLVNGQPNDTLREFSSRLNRYSYQILEYLTFRSDRKPFPFSEFPEANE